MASIARDRISGLSLPTGPGTPAALGLAGPLTALVLGACAMGASPLFVRAVSPDIGPFASAFWRVALALPFLYGWMRMEDRRGPAFSRVSAATWGAGVAFAGDLIFWHLAILHTSVANATFLATMAPVVVVLVTLLLGRAVGRGIFPGLALCILGGAALIGQSMTIAPERLAGDGYGLVTACFFALYFLFVARAREGVLAGRLSFLATLITTAILLPVALVMDGGHVWPQAWSAWASLGALALVSQVGGQGLLAIALGRLPAVFSSLVIFVEALFAAAAGWVVLGEALMPLQGLGGALILFGIWLARPRSGEARS